jgi:Domain of unknown function (DUF2024)
MKVYGFDTYVLKSNGDTAHFDIFVSEGRNSLEKVLTFGKTYLERLGEGSQSISAAECQFCHIEEPTQEVLGSIEQQGFHVIVMDDIPAKRPDHPTRRQLIEHLRAKSEGLRFANFRGKTAEDLWALAGEVK